MEACGPADDRLPVTLLTGFLGSGKTTLLNRLLRRPDLARVAVIVNEFGDIGLDHELVMATTESLVLLDSGCLCCTVRGDLLGALRELIAGRAAGEIEIDRVLIETTGLADPAPILQTLVADPAIARACRLDGVVVTVDACAGRATLARQAEARSQAALADRLLLTKTDLADPAETAALAARLRALNPAAPILRASHGEIAAEQILGCARGPRGAAEAADWLNAAAYPRPDPLASAHPHGDDIRTAAWSVAAPIPPAVFDFWLSTLMAVAGPDILRLKGIVHVEGMPWPFALHTVQHVLHDPTPLRDWTGADRTTRLVVIARGLTEAELHQTFAFLETLGDPPEAEPALPTLETPT